MHTPTHFVRRLISKSEIATWKNYVADVHRWRYFVTFALNRRGDGRPLSDTQIQRQKRLLRQWDGRMNRALFGKQWAKLHHLRLPILYVPEKLHVNAHWHALVSFPDGAVSLMNKQDATFRRQADSIWQELVPSGTFDIKPYAGRRHVDYLAKSLEFGDHYRHYILPGEFAHH